MMRPASFRFFEGAERGPEVAVRIHNLKLVTTLFINPELYAAEA
jgi:hypothetical protein